MPGVKLILARTAELKARNAVVRATSLGYSDIVLAIGIVTVSPGHDEAFVFQIADHIANFVSSGNLPLQGLFNQPPEVARRLEYQREYIDNEDVLTTTIHYQEQPRGVPPMSDCYKMDLPIPETINLLPAQKQSVITDYFGVARRSQPISKTSTTEEIFSNKWENEVF